MHDQWLNACHSTHVGRAPRSNGLWIFMIYRALNLLQENIEANVNSPPMGHVHFYLQVLIDIAK